MWPVLLMILNYFHDLAVALLATNIIVIFILGRYLDRRGVNPDPMPELFRKLSRVTYAALFFVIVMGGVRAWFFMDYEWNTAAGEGQVAALVVKHILLVAITIFGVAGQIRYCKKYGN